MLGDICGSNLNMWTDFTQKMTQSMALRNTNVALFLNPTFEMLPLPITRFDDPFFPYSKAAVQATRDVVCAYVFDFASYLTMAAAGTVALERSIRFAGADHPVILHGPFGHAGYRKMAEATAFGLDAVTISYTRDLDAYLDNEPHAAFVVDNTIEIPQRGGVFADDVYRWRDGSEIVTMRQTPDDLLYVGRLDDWAEQVRAAVEAFR